MAAIALWGVFVVVLLTKPVSGAMIRVFDDVFLAVAAGATALGCFVASSRLGPGSRTPWRYIGTGVALWCAGQIYWAIDQNLIGSITPVPSPADAAYLLSTLVFAAGVGRFPSGTAWASARGLLDGAIVAISLGYVGWNLFLVHAPTDEATLALAYPVTDVFLAATIVVALGRSTVARADFQLLLVAAAVKVGSNAVYLVVLSREDYATGHLVDAGWALWLALTVAATHRATERAPDAAAAGRPAFYILAPYFAVVAALVTRVWAGATGRPLGGVALAFVVAVVVLLLARHAVAILENEALTAGLRKQVEDLREVSSARREGQELLAAVLRGLPGGAYTLVLRPQRQLVFASQGLAELTGYTVEELTERPQTLDLIDERDRAHAAAYLARAVSEGSATYRYRVMRRDGSRRWVENRARATVDGEQVVMNGFIADVTEEIEAARLAEQARRMDAVGRFASVVAHDFNNILTALQAHVCFARQALDDGEPVEEDLAGIDRATQRAIALAAQLLSLGRPVATETEPLHLAEAVTSLRPTLVALMDGVHFEMDIKTPGRRPCVLIDADRAERVVLNLCLNAKDACVASGREDPAVTLRVRDLVIDATSDIQVGLAPGSYVALDVIDNGIGMDADLQEQCLEPFASTKSGGNGLGLTSVAAIVDAVGGAMRVQSEVGVGTRVTALFPRAPARV